MEQDSRAGRWLLKGLRFPHLFTGRLLTNRRGDLAGVGDHQVLLQQKRVRAHLSFNFGVTGLVYSFREAGTHHEHAFDYFEIAKGRRHVSRRDWSRLQLGLLLTVLGACVLMAHAKLGGFTPWSALWLVPGAALLAMFSFSQSHFLVFQAAGQPVWIVDDSRAHDIVLEIDRRRRDQLAEFYAPLNLANEPYLEIRKIEWLVEESVLTRDEAEAQIAQVNAAVAARAAAAAAAAEAAEAEGHGMFAREAIA